MTDKDLLQPNTPLPLTPISAAGVICRKRAMTSTPISSSLLKQPYEQEPAKASTRKCRAWGMV